MVEEQLITNKKTGEELSLEIINNGRYYGALSKLVQFHTVEIKRKGAVHIQSSF